MAVAYDVDGTHRVRAALDLADAVLAVAATSAVHVEGAVK